MALYKYLAAEFDGKRREIIIEADSQNDALSRLRSRGLLPIKGMGEVARSGEGMKKNFFSRKKPDIYEFTNELTPLIAAHIPLERALGIMMDGAERPEQKEFITSLRQGLHEGKKLSSLIRSYGDLFPGFYPNLVETGEESGCLPEVMVELRRFLEEGKETRDFIVSSAIYPMVILGVTLMVTVVLFTVFIPRFVNIFVEMNRPLPPIMQIMNGISVIFGWIWWSVPLLLIFIFVGLRNYLGREKLDEIKSSFALKIPLIGNIIKTLDVARFIQTLSILIKNHVEILRTVKISIRVLQNKVIRDDFAHLESKLKAGEKLSSCLKSSSFIPANVVQMVRVGEESGMVGEMLSEIAHQQELGVKRKMKRLLSLFEPVVIIFLALIVLTVVVSIFLAIMELNAIN